MPYPVEITSVFKSSTSRRKAIPDAARDPYAGLVELKSGGFSFIARDSEGDVWVWGQLDASFFGGQWDYASASKRVVTPTKLGLPAPIQKTRYVQCLRRLICCISVDNGVVFTALVAGIFCSLTSRMKSGRCELMGGCVFSP